MFLAIEGIGKVARADIEIAGITVIAGENDTGKSTVGKVLYSVFNTLNALYIFSELRKMNWSEYAIYGLSGNIMAEGNFNPGYWQSGKIGNTNVGYGIVQWTAANGRYYIKWAQDKGLDIDDIDAQLLRIKTEVETNIDTAWKKVGTTLTFYDFTQSQQDSRDLAEIFHKCYERNGSDSSQRRLMATMWETIFQELMYL